MYNMRMGPGAEQLIYVSGIYFVHLQAFSDQFDVSE